MILPLFVHDPKEFLKNLRLSPLVPIPGPQGCLCQSQSCLSMPNLTPPAFLGLNPDQACLDLSLPAHNQGAGRRVWDQWEHRMDCGRRGKDAEKVTLTVTHTFIPVFTLCANRESIHRIEEEWRGRYETGVRETRHKQA